jgi:hypothetical protein
VHVLQTYQQDWLAGAMYGTRQFGNEQWNQWTVTVSARVQGTNTATFSDQWYGYVFFNQANRQIVFASGDVFSNADEMRDVCQRLGGSQCTNLSELSRTTGGVGLTWARADVITGNRLSLHLFFEGGAETYRRFSETGAGTAAAAPPSRSVSPVFRTGAGIEYVQQSTTSVIPNIYSLSLAAQSGTWPLLGGEVTRPEMLQSWSQQLEQSWPGWSIMAHGRVQW